MMIEIRKSYELRQYTWNGMTLWHEWQVFIDACIRREVEYITVNLTLTKDGVIFNNEDKQ